MIFVSQDAVETAGGDFLFGYIVKLKFKVDIERTNNVQLIFQKVAIYDKEFNTCISG